MDWDAMGSESQDRRRAANHVGFPMRGYYMEEGLVHADDGTLVGKLITSHRLGRPSSFVVFAHIEETREDRIRAMSHGAQS